MKVLALLVWAQALLVGAIQFQLAQGDEICLSEV
jgi:hypothetical protein